MTNTTNPTQKFYTVAWSRPGTETPMITGADRLLTTDVEAVKARAAELNQAMEPEYQNYTVATITFDPEV